MLCKTKFSEIIGKNIRTKRQERNMTQDELSHKCGFYRTYINMIETSRRTPSSYTLYKIAKALKVEVYELYPTTV